MSVEDLSMWREKGSWKPSLCVPTRASSKVWGWAEAQPSKPPDGETDSCAQGKSLQTPQGWPDWYSCVPLMLLMRNLMELLCGESYLSTLPLGQMMTEKMVSMYNHHPFLFYSVTHIPIQCLITFVLQIVLFKDLDHNLKSSLLSCLRSNGHCSVTVSKTNVR